MTRFLITTMMTLTFVFGGLAVSTSSAQACDSCAAHKKKAPSKTCDKCKKAGKKSCDCAKKKSTVDADQLNCGKCKKGCKGCDKCKKGGCDKCKKGGCDKCKKGNCDKCKDCPKKKDCGCK
ncbi:MAG: hypothetical protein JRH20_10930 [Deltaproteobacteria bacterium]|nr:hypothetical protein [Deltaproteobacteria bacterium]